MTGRGDPESFYTFDDAAREIHFRRHDMPTPWINYLSNGTLHAILSQAGGGFAFYRSPQIWRMTRYRFFHLPTDRPGPYIYIQDAEDGTTWCPSYEPAPVHPTTWQATHGLGYTRFQASHAGLEADLTYFVGDQADALIWHLVVKNAGASTRRVRLYAYVEFSMMEFLREIQWQCYNKHQVSVTWDEELKALIYNYGVEMQPRPEETPLVYFGADREPSAYDGDRDEFIGSYRSESDPFAIEQGGCTGSTLLGGDPCGALEFDVELAAGAQRALNIFLGAAEHKDEIALALAQLRQPGAVAGALERLRDGWARYLDKMTVRVPDAGVQRQINIWNPYQAQRNFQFSRNISFYATGTFRGVGFRDTAQDILAQIPFDADASKDKLRLLLGQQYCDGHVNHYFFPVEGWEPVTTIHSDDHLWPIWAVHSLVMETGELAFLNEVIPYYDRGEAPVYEHLRQAIAFTQQHMGTHYYGLPLMLRSDWNDQMTKVCREGKGESVWTAMQLGTMLQKLAELARLLGRDGDAEEYLALYADQAERVNRVAWDGRWYRRAVMDNGRFLGTAADDQARIWINTQSWAVISGMATRERGETAMDAVKEMLDTGLGLKILHPPITDFPSPADPLTHYHPGTGENAAIFCHANTWAIIAECLLGHADRAYAYYRQLIPAVAMAKAGVWRYKAEPYTYASNLFGPDSDKFGLANVSWLTGTAAWMYVAATQYLLGVRPAWEGLEVRPCIPSAWMAAHVERDFRGCRYDLHIRQGRGEPEIRVDGHLVKGAIIPHVPGRDYATIEVTV